MHKILAMVCMVVTPFVQAESNVREKLNEIADKYGCFVQWEVQRMGTNVDPHLFVAQIYVESTGDPNACSSSEACGLMQVKEMTLGEVRRVSKKLYPNESFEDDLFDPRNNIRAGIQYYHYILHDYKDGMAYDDPMQAFAGYHDGAYGGSKLTLQEAHNHSYVRKIERVVPLVRSRICSF